MSYNKIIELSNSLRNKGVCVSIRNTELACHVWDLLKYKVNDDEFKYALKSVYIKDPSYDKIYNDTYDRLFRNKTSEFTFKNKKENNNTIDNYITENNGIVTINEVNKPFETQKRMQTEIEQESNHRVNDQAIINQNINNIEHDQRAIDICRKLGIKIANQRTKRQKHAKVNHIDMQRTIRYNLKNGGKLITLLNTKPPKKKSRHFFLNDVSGSCEWISSWFFNIMYGCKRSFDRVKTYEFDNKIVDMSNALDTESYDRAYQYVMNLRMRNGMIHGRSDMTNSFKMFLDEVSLNKRSNVIILTDCRDWRGKREEGILESAMILKKMVKESHKVMILNPESKIRWNTPTSCVRDYQNVGAEVYEIGTLDHFANLISRL